MQWLPRSRLAGCTFAWAALFAGGGFAQVQVEVDKAVRYQTIDGFGASVTVEFDITPWKLRDGPFLVDVDLDSVGFYDSIITELGATAIRTDVRHTFSPASGQYGVNDEINELWRDLRKLRDAAERHHEPLMLIGSVWSPPGWMKVNEQAPCERAGSPDYRNTDCRLKDGYDDTLGAYLVKYVQTMTDSGLPYDAVSIQNEPAFTEPYQSCVYNGARYTLTLKAVGRAFEEAGLPQRFYGAEHMAWAFPSQIERTVRTDPVALRYMRAWAVHGYRDGLAIDTGAYQDGETTDKPLWMSETGGGGDWGDWDAAMVCARNILTYLRRPKVSLWTWWTLQLPSADAYKHSIHAGGRPTLKWHISRHFYRYIRPGARHVGSSSSDDDVMCVAFWHDGGQCLSVVLINSATTDKNVSGVVVSNGSAPSRFERITSTADTQIVVDSVGASDQIVLPANSVTTLVSGIYRGTDSLTAVREPCCPARVRRSTGRGLRAPRVYSIDGRLVGPVGAKSLREGHGMVRNVYITVDEKGRARKTFEGPVAAQSR